MDQAGVNRVPVVDTRGRPVGILTRDDVLHVLARSLRRLGLPAGGRPQMEPD
jgi:CBS domain-containing protein